jgi:tetratricopeptide (TPR) repeat protein
MQGKFWKIYLMACVIILAANSAWAELIRFKSGRQVEGEIISHSNSYIRVLTRDGEEVFMRDEIDFIGQRVSEIFQPEYDIVKMKQSPAEKETQEALKKGVAEYKKENYFKAQEYFEQVLKLNPQAAWCYSNLAAVYNGRGLYHDAESFAQQALEKNKALAQAHYNLAVAEMGMAKLDEAITSYTKAIELESNFTEAYLGRAMAFKNKGDLQRALFDFEQTLRFAPRSFLANFEKAQVLAKLGRFKEARDAYEKATRLNPRHVMTWNNLGSTYARLGQHKEAIQAYEKALELDWNDANLHYNLGLVYYQQGRLKKMSESFEKALVLFRRAKQEDKVQKIEEILLDIAKGSVLQAESLELLEAVDLSAANKKNFSP